MSFGDFVGDLMFYYRSGGFVMPPLVIATVLMWYGLGYRIAVIKRGSDDPVRLLVDRVRDKGADSLPRRGIVPNAVLLGLEAQGRRLPNLRDHLDVAFGRYRQMMKGFSIMTQSIIAIAPLLGLLGTVVGMIITFQVITEVGSGDPKVMAGGISQAMVATVLGLIIAIPLLFVNSFLISRSRTLTQILDEQAAGLLAQRLEAQGVAGGAEPAATTGGTHA